MSNKPLDALRHNFGGWRWYGEDIRVPPLYQAVEAQHRAAALIVWPVRSGRVPASWSRSTGARGAG